MSGTRIYYTDPACHEFDATVVSGLEQDGRPAVVLDRTAFYPSSGGQPHDTGTINGVHVVDVIDSGDEVIHVLAAPLPPGALVHGVIDWTRRADHMQQHTGQHVLSAAFERTTGNATTSFHMGADVSTIDLEREATAAEILLAENEANRIVWEDHPVAIKFATADEAAGLPLRKESLRTGTLRLIEISAFDLSACGGTHVASTGAIGIIAVTGVERVKGSSRVTFVCGSRALRTLRTLRDAVAGSVKLLSVLPAELPGAIDRLQQESKDQRKTLKEARERLAVHEAASLLGGASAVGPIRMVVRSLEGWDAPGLKALASSATLQGQAVVALLTATAPTQVVIARSADVAVDAGAVVRQLIERFGGKGGGKPDLAQAGGLTGDLREMVLVASELLEKSLS